MGFWHTGYMEFHEPVGLGADWTWSPPIPKWKCDLCTEELDSPEQLRKHRFEAHRRAQPVLFFRGRQLGRTPRIITKSAKGSDFVLGNCTTASINGVPVAIKDLSSRLASLSNDTALVSLSNVDLSAEFEFVFAIASEADLDGVEREFQAFADGRSLNRSTIDAFSEACRSYSSAAHYYDGICQYLYGVLIKERSPQASLAFEQYLNKFTQASHALADYDRRLARTVRALVSFHFNQFSDAVAQLPNSGLALVAARFSNWVEGVDQTRVESSTRRKRVSTLEDTLSDATCKAILEVALVPNLQASENIDRIKSLLESKPPPLDQVKLEILLAESQLAAGHFENARRTARQLVNDPGTMRWAERMIGRARGKV